MVIDTLELNIIVNSPSAVNRINSVSGSLGRLKTLLLEMQGLDLNKVIADLTNIANVITPLATALNGLGAANKNLSGLSTRLRTLGKNMAEIDADVMARKFNQMTTSITPFIEKIKSAEASLVALNSIMRQTNSASFSTTAAQTSRTTIIPRTTREVRGSKSSTGIGGFFSKIYRLYFAITLARRLGETLGNVVQKGIDFEETLNLWQTAMRGNISEARKFVAEMNKAYGVSTATLMNYQGVFKNMLAALGNISEDSAYKLSEALTQMALDFASLYNTTVETAMTKLQSVLAGQVRPVRTAGYDITENTIYQLYQSLGGTKTVRQLTQTEKQLLRILAVFKQMGKSGATGDLRKTISSSANQLRIMKEQGAEFATWIGIAFNTLLDSSGILVKINSYILVAKELAKSFAYDMGYVEKDYQISLETEDIDNANEKVDELKGKLLGFDKFQVLSSGGISQELSVEQTILNAIQEYETILGKAQNPAWVGDLTKGIKGAQKILEDLGYELVDIKNEQGEVVDQVWRQKEGQKSVLDTVKETAKSLGGLLTFIGLMTKPWLTLVGAIEYAYWTNEDFRDSINKMLTQLGGAGLKVFQSLAELFVKIAPYLARIVEKFVNIVDLLDELGLLEETIALVCAGLLLWKNRQMALKILAFVNNIRAQIRVMRLLRTETDALNASNLLAGKGIGTVGTIMTSTYTRTMTLVAGISLLSSGFMDLQNWSDMSGLEKWATVLKMVAGAAFLAATAIATFHSAWSVGAAAIAIGGAVALVTASVLSAIDRANAATANIEKRAKGGLATKGSLFWAGEAGPELVTRTSGGNSTIMNMQQLEDAVAKGMFRAMANTSNWQEEQTIAVGIDGQNLFTILRKVAKRNGYDLVKVN